MGAGGNKGGGKNFSASKLRGGAKFQCQHLEGGPNTPRGGGGISVHGFRGGGGQNRIVWSLRGANFYCAGF